MNAYDAGVLVAMGTDTFDSWSQLHKCLPLATSVSRQTGVCCPPSVRAPERGAAHWSAATPREYFKRDFWGLIPIRRSATDRTGGNRSENKSKTQRDRMTLSNNYRSAAKEARS